VEDKIFVLSVISPAGTSGTISVPVLHSGSTVYVNNIPAWEQNRSKAHGAQFIDEDGGYVSLEVTGGEYTVRAE